MKLACTVILVILLIISFLSMIHDNIEGKKAKAPQGFSGVVATLIVCVITWAILYGAGAFDSLISYFR